MKPRAIVLLSGGLDSATALAIAQHEGFEPYALSFRYGQRHSVELAAAHRVAAHRGVARHVVADIDLRVFGGSALTDDIPVPKDSTPEEIAAGIPVTYIPARNTVFLSFALAYAETAGAFDIFTGVNAVDYSGYPDCRPEYLEAFEAMANLATRAGVEGRRLRLRSPLVRLTKGEIIKRGLELGVDYSLTSSCYDPDPQGRACGRCDTCRLRLKGFAEAGVPDPIAYRSAV
ncbi:7-cyano-7-deazaguanine synthase QueC [Streptomonospora nanhaiensis]|uniref:7-cyano-7-deazaguanine synthase n=1 Tax=Streptomonospora nanhaiensis TaxID=1323731 RepID=A0A853BWW0_9ACTN|nr:7-cyano-7-deazaguanine synthase QueC [Streptomonospora nanhaiensis]MBV2365561.1 7-cyano-7-deazaguanine synthase QueC [Streptomonospora nanhaiensis]MBX9387115.1 7-cyano-7-deazaguanine synthase QueC [Streptomonospora nanhaiensis]NYI98947.1 7-cyano-7-deazaguanine synthase [Streptomonospora nanhaiensis]